MTSRFYSCAALAAIVCFASTAAAIAQDDPKNAVVKRITVEMDAFSRGDRAAFVASYVVGPRIVDDVAPYAWNDAGGWYDAVRPLFRDVTMAPGSPLEVLVDASHAFIALPFTIVGHGRKGSVFKASGYWTGALVQNSGVWRITNATITISE